MALERWDRGKWDSAHWDGQLSLAAQPGGIVVAGHDAALIYTEGTGDIVLEALPGAVTISGSVATLRVKRMWPPANMHRYGRTVHVVQGRW